MASTGLIKLNKLQKLINVKGTTGSSGWTKAYVQAGGGCCVPTKEYPPKINGAHVAVSSATGTFISPMCDTCNDPKNTGTHSFANLKDMYVYRDVLGGANGMKQQAVNHGLQWRNVGGSSGATPPSPYKGYSWIQWYALCNKNAKDGSVVKTAMTGKQATFPTPACYGCGGRFFPHLAGAHVGILDNNSLSLKLASDICFIVPMCSGCNTGKKVVQLQREMGAMPTGDKIKIVGGECVPK